MPSRREFCAAAGAALWAPAFLEPFAAQAAGNGPILVAILLAGGNDGLNTVVPLQQYGTYNQLRTSNPAPADPTLNLAIPLANLANTAFDPNPATPAAQATQFAFHPNMTALRQVYGSGHMALITGMGLPPDEPNRLSHEVGQFDWQSGNINELGRYFNGWLGLTLDPAAGGALPPMISLTGQAPILMKGRVNSALAVGVPIESFNLDFATGSAGEIAARRTAFSLVDASPSGETSGDFIRRTSTSASGFIDTIQTVATSVPASDYPTPTSNFAQQLKQIARLILSNKGTRAYYAVIGGFDNHTLQAHVHPTLLQQVSDGIAGFYAYLQAKNASSNVIIMTFSDFGRRANVNSGFGTDHGTASVNFVIGDGVKGGVYGQYPDISKLDNGKNLVVQLDFRNLLSDVILAMGADPTPIVGKTYTKLGFI